MKYTEYEINIIQQYYPIKGAEFVAKLLNRKSRNIRMKACSLKIRFDKTSEFFKEFHSKSNKSRLGIKKPELSIRCKEMFRRGELKIPSFSKHNLSKDKSYPTWNSMMNRCYNLNNKGYHNYGGRGIGVCEEWKDPINFKKWFDCNFIKNCSVDRVDTNGNYDPKNCRFATNYEQMRNRRDTKINNFIVRVVKKMNQEKIPQSKIAKIFDMSKPTINKIVLGYRWGNVNLTKLK